MSLQVAQIETLVQQIRETSDTVKSDDPHEELAQLDSIIAHVDHLFKYLILKQVPLKSTINQLESPIIRLPPELLSHIFTFCIVSDQGLIGKQDKVTPLFLGSICRMWRETAWAAPQLWLSMNLHLGEQDIPAVRKLVQQWLDRSGGLPLHLGISCDEKSARSEIDPIMLHESDIRGILQLFFEHSDRWRHLNIRIPWHFFGDLKITSSNNCPLEYLRIDPVDGQSEHDYALTLDHLPNLRKLNVASLYLKSLNLQWDNITHVSAKAFFLDEGLELLRRCPRLVCLKLPLIIGGEGTFPLSNEPILLPSLRFLQINPERFISVARFLDRLVLPALEELHHDGSGKNMELQPFLSLLARSSCPLNSFSISNVRTEYLGLLQLLEKMPSLKKLSITWTILELPQSIMTTELLERMNLDMTILPSLEALEYTGPQIFFWAHFPEFMDGSTSPFAPSLARSEASESVILNDAPTSNSISGRRPLRAVKFISLSAWEDRTMDNNTLPRLLALMEQGRYVDIQYSSEDVLAKAIAAHEPDDLGRYTDLRKKMLSTWKDPFAEDEQWSV